MSITKEITLWCDDCSVWEQVRLMPAAKLRAGMKRYQGWTSTKVDGVVVDRCPNCSAKARETEVDHEHD